MLYSDGNVLSSSLHLQTSSVQLKGVADVFKLEGVARRDASSVSLIVL